MSLILSNSFFVCMCHTLLNCSSIASVHLLLQATLEKLSQFVYLCAHLRNFLQDPYIELE